MIDRDFWKRYRFFRENGSDSIVGRSAVYAFALASAEQTAEKRGLVAVWEDEEESYESVYGEPLPDGVAGPFWAAVRHPETNEVLASMGMITLAMGGDPYRRFVDAELFQEALDVLDEEDEEAARVLATRATYAGVSL